ncbi:MAG: histidine phosphatase family protein [Anaerolineae bacterium]|nr:histidine phosphatase family protein [Anaerolineae bacterium]
MHLLFVRHGQSYVNLDDWEGGYVDAGLTPLGRQQAERVGQWMAGNARVDALYTSTMARALETCAAITAATGIAAQPDDRLREFGNCYADGSPVPAEAMPIHYAEFWGTERPYAPISENGESWILFRVRVGTFLDDILARHGDGDPETTVVVVCHGGVIDATFDYIFNVGAQRRVEVWTHNTGIVHWEYAPDSGREPWRLHAHGMVHHLITDDGQWLGARPLLRDASQKALSVKHDHRAGDSP